VERKNDGTYSNAEISFPAPQSSFSKESSPSKDRSKALLLLLDLLVYLVCAAGIAVSLNLFRLDLFRTLTRITEQPVGTITFKYKAAQRRFVDRVLWDRLRKESPVYNGDFIRTAELSEATITFPGGTVIDLAENSLIQIHEDSRGARIDIDGGGLSVNAAASASELVLASGESLIAVEAGAVVDAGVEGGGFLFRVVEGAAQYTDGGGTGRASAGDAFALGGGSREVRGASALSPRPAARFLNPERGTLPIPFRWNRINLTPEEPVRLEIAGDREFTRVVFREDYAGTTASVDLEAGSWYWRLSPAGGENAGSADAAALSASLSLKIIPAAPPVLITPAEGYRYEFRLKRPSVRFQWTEAAEAASYILEAADNPGMAGPALSREVRGTSLYTSELGPGTWYWRVRPVYPAAYEGVPGAGAPASFRITQSGTLRAPELRNPPDQGLVNVAAGRELYFSWRGEAEARSYTIRISANRDLSSPLVNETVGDNFYGYRTGRNLIGPGNYYWAVLQTDGEGNPSALSPARSFTALEGEVIQRTVFPPEGYTIGMTMLPDLRFTWKTNLTLPARFQISGRADFSRPEIDEAVSGEVFQGRPLPEGIWYWRIHARGPGGTVFETPPKSFTAAPPLPAPALEQPGPDGRVLVQEEEPVVFSWGAAAGAEYYQFKLYYGGENRPVYENNLVEGTSHSIPMDAYADGRYRWTVQGFTPESARSTRRTGLLSEGAFIARKLHPVSLDYPEDGAAVEGLRAYREPGTVRWSSADPVASSRFILSRNRDLSGQAEAVIADPSASVTLPRLREGDYYWTVRAETADGFDISARAARLFRVLPIPPLPAAANRLPRDGTVLTGTELRQNRRIAFSWDAVPGATGYLFTVTQAGRAVIPERLLRETGFALEDLTLLDLGEFVWRVEAVLAEPARERREEEEIIQRGEIGENRFRIAFALPGVPDLPEPGTLYGRED
jgi:hypothetical protein